MTVDKKTIGKAAGISAAAAAIATLSAYFSTRFLLKLAIDREEPLLLRNAEKRLAGAKEKSDFLKKLDEGAESIRKKNSQTVQILGSDGTPLIGHWVPANGARRIILAVHGWRGDWAQTFGVSSNFFEEQHCSVLYIEQRATNQSGGDYIAFGLMEREDCLCWVRWLTENGPELPIYLCGVSMGATTVLMAAGLELPKNVHGIIADCDFTSPHAIWDHVARNNLHIAFHMRGMFADEMFRRKLRLAPDFSTTEVLKENAVPILFVHGTDDHFVPVEMTYENYLACHSPKRILIVPGADHGESYYMARESYQKELLAFWKDYDFLPENTFVEEDADDEPNNDNVPG